MSTVEAAIKQELETSTISKAPSTDSENARYPVTVQPMDEHNRRLLDNVHPPDYETPIPDGRYNLVVIGSGTAGLVGAIGAAGLGGKAAIIERHLLGGDCLNWGCVPSKSVIRSARTLAELRSAPEFGVHLEGDVRVDFPAIMERMRALRADISHDDSMQRLQGEGVDVFLGDARFIDDETIEVSDANGQRQTIRFAKALIATGARARELPVPGLPEAGYLTNETLFQLSEQPARMAVIGGGPIGAEMSQAFARFGTQVTMFIKDNLFLPREDREAADLVQRAFERDGVQLLCDTELKSVEQTDNGKRICYELDGKPQELEVDAILVSIGRVPNIKGLNLEAADVRYSAAGVEVDDTMRTSNPKVFASGDVALNHKFTHTADASSRIVLQNALFPGPSKKYSDLVIPWTTYTDPEVAHVGLYAHEAEEQGIEIDTFTKSLAEVDRSRTDGETDGFVKVHVKRGTDKIMGATIVASQAGEMLNEVTLAMVAGVGLKTLATVIHPYPTQSEAIKKIADEYNRTRLTPTVNRLFARWMRWSRRG